MSIEYKLFYEKKSVYDNKNGKSEWAQQKIIISNDNEAIHLALVYLEIIDSRSASKYIDGAYLVTPRGNQISINKSHTL